MARITALQGLYHNHKNTCMQYSVSQGDQLLVMAISCLSTINYQNSINFHKRVGHGYKDRHSSGLSAEIRDQLELASYPGPDRPRKKGLGIHCLHMHVII